MHLIMHLSIQRLLLTLATTTILFNPMPSHSTTTNYHNCTPPEQLEFPHWCGLLASAIEDPELLAAELHTWAQHVKILVNISSPIPTINDSTATSRRIKNVTALPTVLTHGMGDSCFNEGMSSITRATQLMTHSTATCIAIGGNAHEDTINGYLLNMDASVDMFAQTIQHDTRLTHGFNAIGFSQGANIIRGYIIKYNNPPVHTFLSLNGVNAGIGGVPYCLHQSKPITTGLTAKLKFTHMKHYWNNYNVRHYRVGTTNTKLCDALMETTSTKAYTDFAQYHSFQANYWRDLRSGQKEHYLKYSQLANWNNEAAVNQSFIDNFAKTKVFVWIMALKDTIVWPKEGEWWGAPDPDHPFGNPVRNMGETDWYTNDLFGLKTAEQNGKMFFESFDGDHLGFSMENYEMWINKYLM